VLTAVVLLVCIGATAAVDFVGEPPNYLVALLGSSAAAFFTALSSDQSKRTAENIRAEIARAKTEGEAKGNGGGDET
jgi:hypothetical protein